MLASKHFDDAKAKLSVAHTKLRDFRVQIDRFLTSSPYLIDVYEAPGVREYWLKVLKTPPPELSIEFGLILQLFRSALDFTACGLAVRSGAHSIKKISFPIGNGSEDDFDEWFKEQPLYKVGLREQDLIKIKSLQPYRDATYVLYALSQLNNTDKHREILMVDLGRGTANITGMGCVQSLSGWDVSYNAKAPMYRVEFTGDITLECNVTVGVAPIEMTVQ